MTTKLSYLSLPAYEELLSGIENNIHRYASGNFDDILSKPGAIIETDILFDADQLKKLNEQHRFGSSWDGRNSFRIVNVLGNLTRDIATFERIWAKLCHDELLVYARGRWLSGGKVSPGDIKKHLFGLYRTGFRDDNAIGRLWWTGKIGSSLYQSGSVRKADECRKICALFRTAQRRQDTIERPRIFNQPDIARGIIRHVENGYLTGGDDTREFMKKVNSRASGLVFGALSKDEADSIFIDCS